MTSLKSTYMENIDYNLSIIDSLRDRRLMNTYCILVYYIMHVSGSKQ